MAARHSSAVGANNAEVAALLREIADLLTLQLANPFRVRAYEGAARTVEELPRPVLELPEAGSGSLLGRPGIGADLAGKIRELARSGSCVLLRQLRRKVPRGLPELMRLRGLGPRRAQLLRRKLGITSIPGLERALRAGRVRRLRGFGERSEAKLLHEIGQRRATGARVLRATAAQYAEPLAEYLRGAPGALRVELAGSYRRCAETVGDLDLLAAAETGTPLVDWFVRYPEVVEVLTQGASGASVRLRSGLQVDLRVLRPESYGSGLYYFTGSKAHNIAMRRLAQVRGLKLNEYGVFRRNRRRAGLTEEDVAAAVGVGWIPPELREDRGEIEAAQAGRLPKLLRLEDIRGDLQCHTTSSDGRDRLPDMVGAAEALGYEYLAITDHSPALRMVRGLDRAGYRRQARAIERLNARSRRITVLKGTEVDILKDGTLDLDDETLASFDVVLAAIHSHFDLSAREQTRRLARALRHPAVQILAHPTGRLIGERQGIRVDLDEVLSVAAGEGVVLEVNAQPTRLDLDDGTAKAALDRGIRLAVNTDAHSIAELGFMRWGVDQARRGWATARDVINTRSLPTLLKQLRPRRRARAAQAAPIRTRAA
jgi:DNA polymerase (family 10)